MPPRDRSKSPDDFLAQVSDAQRAALERLRRSVRVLYPDAEECMSYGLPAFRLNGRPFVAYGASAKHCAFYPMSPEVIDAHARDLAAFETSKGTIRFQPDHPIPKQLLKKLLAARAAELR
jgi:uncharacterized protein YdhG (YjbR/CyaY superfamily)